MLPALAACALFFKGSLLIGGIGLVVCVWWDALAGFIGRRSGWNKSQSDIQIEGFADAICFVVTPSLMTAVAVDYRLIPLVTLPVFVLAGIWRLARFNVEGLVGKGYAGLPVTYNGYLVPAAVLIQHCCPLLPDAAWYPLILGLASLLMVSRRFVTPEL